MSGPTSDAIRPEPPVLTSYAVSLRTSPFLLCIMHDVEFCIAVMTGL